MRVIALLFLLVMSACASAPENWQPDIPGLTQAVQRLAPTIDPNEAARAAQISYSYSAELAVAYNVTDAPLIHNTKVNQGLRPRGLCWHWADDLEARLRQEQFKTLVLHRAIANSDTILIQHSTVIVSAKGQDMEDGIVLDPWRYGGRLFWAPMAEDTRYRWLPRRTVFEERNGS